MSAGEMWWQFADIVGTTLAELEGLVMSLLFVADAPGGWCIEIHREGEVFRAESSRPGVRGYGSVTRITRGPTPYLALSEARRELEAFEAEVIR